MYVFGQFLESIAHRQEGDFAEQTKKAATELDPKCGRLNKVLKWTQRMASVCTGVIPFNPTWYRPLFQ